MQLDAENFKEGVLKKLFYLSREKRFLTLDEIYGNIEVDRVRLKALLDQLVEDDILWYDQENIYELSIKGMKVISSDIIYKDKKIIASFYLPSDLPLEVLPFFDSFNTEAIELLRIGEYNFAKDIFKSLIDEAYALQKRYNKVYCKNAWYTNLAISYILLLNIEKSLKYSIVSYIEYFLTGMADIENRDKYYDNSYIKYYNVKTEYLNILNNIIDENINKNIADPEILFNKFLLQTGYSSKEIEKICQPCPTPDDLIKKLYYEINERALKRLTDNIEENIDLIKEMAYEIAKKKGRIDIITEEDINEAINKMKLK